MKQLDLVGKRFGKLLVVEKLNVNNKGNLLFKCLCDCGNEKIDIGSNIKRRLTCCGCSNGDTKRRVKYLNTQLYEIWKGMRARCRYKKHIAYKNYGGKGVTVCKEWDNDFKPFYEWCMANGWKDGMQIDKDIIPKKLGIKALLYSPEYCSIVTAQENSHASSKAKITEQDAEDIRESVLPAKVLSKKYGLDYTQILRIKTKKAWRKQNET
mgnify:CR=1 FL=1